MAIPRLFVSAALGPDQGDVALDPAQSHYLVNVLRLGAGAGLFVFNGRDGEWRAEIAVASKKAAALRLIERTRAQHGCPDLHLLFAPIKKTRTDFIVEKATELGASVIRPVFTRRTVAERVNAERLALIAREAAEQTERLDVPEVRAGVGLVALLRAWSDTDGQRRLVFCDEQAADGSTAPAALEAFQRLEPGAPWAVLIGPEGGFDAAERTALHGYDFVLPVALGPRILRADTAALAALALWQASLGDWARTERK